MLIEDRDFVGLDVVVDILGEEGAVLLQVRLLLLLHVVLGQEEDLPGKAEPLIVRLDEVVLSGGRELVEPLLDVLDDDPQLGVLLPQLLQLQSRAAVLLRLSPEGRVEDLLQVAQLSARPEAIRSLEVTRQELRESIPQLAQPLLGKDVGDALVLVSPRHVRQGEEG